VPCMEPLDTHTLERRLADLPGWEARGGALRKSYTFDDFAGAMAYANRVAEAAEEADHHPDMLVGWGRVELAWVSHSDGGITEKDIDMARRSDELT
jgi:4a-hydroxytetrahydrobiopterin dehydratase